MEESARAWGCTGKSWGTEAGQPQQAAPLKGGVCCHLPAVGTDFDLSPSIVVSWLLVQFFLKWCSGQIKLWCSILPVILHGTCALVAELWIVVGDRSEGERGGGSMLGRVVSTAKGRTGTQRRCGTQ